MKCEDLIKQQNGGEIPGACIYIALSTGWIARGQVYKDLFGHSNLHSNPRQLTRIGWIGVNTKVSKHSLID